MRRQSGSAVSASHYLRRLYYDTVCYDLDALQLAYKLAGPHKDKGENGKHIAQVMIEPGLGADEQQQDGNR